MKDCFKNKVVLMTGAAQGIGLSTAQEFAHAGANVIMWLCSPYSTFVDGAAISVDGGFTIH